MMMVVAQGGKLHSGRDYSRGMGMGQVQFLVKLDFVTRIVLFYTIIFPGGTLD
jgi:hypothetical protein